MAGNADDLQHNCEGEQIAPVLFALTRHEFYVHSRIDSATISQNYGLAQGPVPLALLL
jgi:hypothetical protein